LVLIKQIEITHLEIGNKTMLDIQTFQLGPAMTNAYLVADSDTNEAVVIDPAWDGDIILAAAQERGWQIRGIWVTHAHFDHIGGTARVLAGLSDNLPVALHSEDLPLWNAQGGAPFFGIHFESTVEPTVNLSHHQTLALGNYIAEVRHAPGHTRGHVMFYFREAGVLFSGDVIFQGSVGRTDLPGGDWNTLLSSIRKQVLTLPDETRIFSGHGPVTTIGREKKSNPFLNF
jgi:glyoxylase-like metal-dependent hydrolase (beta-lactamase superfamily II)